ncbi:hypothetical protein GO988_00465 [Hymenobacter sp. HMF4947]|uniref:Lipoprotein n=1 Tax=Hymenobacter ginkgonis TaxID=2682976 RepID=A0A7K1T8R6_9BACT|nr:hypothetical protein [Hymenobacter ginkgonis]MVN74790.1 hypothetical protein [Hymenobacter ginkgonis]
MKARYLLLPPLALLLQCGTPPQQRAEAAASRYVRASVHDPGSYEIVRTTSRPYTRQDSVQEAARAALRQSSQAGPTPPATPKPSAGTDTTHVGWLVDLTYRIKEGYSPATTQKGTFVVYPSGEVVPVAQ